HRIHFGSSHFGVGWLRLFRPRGNSVSDLRAPSLPRQSPPSGALRAMAMLKCLLTLSLATSAAAVSEASDTTAALRAEIAELRAELRAGLESRQRAEEVHAAELHAELESSRAMEEARAAEAGRRLAAEAEERRLSSDATVSAMTMMFMHAGFTMLETGCCRAKNASNVLMKNLVNVCLGTIGWWAVGYGFAYGVGDNVPAEDAGGNGFIGLNGFFAHDYLFEDPDGNHSSDGTQLAWFFQWAFCTVGATIVSGAVAERVLSSTYGFYVLIMTGFIYPVVVAWTWGYGWIMMLFDVGVIDFAGSGIVHLTGGISGLAGTVVLGPRKGRWENPEAFDPHNLPLVVLGTFILWFGWYGFNCGSTLGMDQDAGLLAAHVAMNTTLAAATGGIVVFFLRFAIYRYYDVGGLCNGILAGLVSITAPCGNVEAGSAVVIGLIGAILYQLASMLLRKLKIDDPVDAVPVHGACGIWGVLAAVFFDMGTLGGNDHFHGWSGFGCMTNEEGECAEGLFVDALLAHLIMIGVIIAWSGILSGVVFFLLKLTGCLRIDSETEDVGVDARKHSPSKAYSMGDSTPGNAQNADTEAI
ncbi:unnamed protein product, partial [Prorocentrum cordatum]